VFNETGRVGVLIKYPVHGRGLVKVFQCYFDRVERLTDRVHALVYLLNIAMLNRPYSKIDGTIMPLKNFSTKDKKLDARFKGPDEFDVEEVSIFDEIFVGKMPIDLRSILEQILEQREYYYSHKDPNSKSIEDLKRVRVQEKPEAVVPSHKE
jgi:hypothetical protein